MRRRSELQPPRRADEGRGRQDRLHRPHPAVSLQHPDVSRVAVWDAADHRGAAHRLPRAYLRRGYLRLLPARPWLVLVDQPVPRCPAHRRPLVEGIVSGDAAPALRPPLPLHRQRRTRLRPHPHRRTDRPGLHRRARHAPRVDAQPDVRAHDEPVGQRQPVHHRLPAVVLRDPRPAGVAVGHVHGQLLHVVAQGRAEPEHVAQRHDELRQRRGPADASEPVVQPEQPPAAQTAERAVVGAAAVVRELQLQPVEHRPEQLLLHAAAAGHAAEVRPRRRHVRVVRRARRAVEVPPRHPFGHRQRLRLPRRTRAARRLVVHLGSVSDDRFRLGGLQRDVATGHRAPRGRHRERHGHAQAAGGRLLRLPPRQRLDQRYEHRLRDFSAADRAARRAAPHAPPVGGNGVLARLPSRRVRLHAHRDARQRHDAALLHRARSHAVARHRRRHAWPRQRVRDAHPPRRFHRRGVAHAAATALARPQHRLQRRRRQFPPRAGVVLGADEPVQPAGGQRQRKPLALPRLRRRHAARGSARPRLRRRPRAASPVVVQRLGVHALLRRAARRPAPDAAAELRRVRARRVARNPARRATRRRRAHGADDRGRALRRLLDPVVAQPHRHVFELRAAGRRDAHVHRRQHV